MSQYNHEKLLKLARELLPNDPSLVEEMKEIIEDTPEHSVRYEGAWQDGVGWYAVEVEENLHEILWDTLLNELRECNRLVELDRIELPDDIAQNIDELLEDLPPDANRWNWIETEGWGWKDRSRWYKLMPNGFLKEVQKRVISPDKLLVRLDVDSVEYEVCLIDAFRFEKIKKLSQESCYGKIVKVEDL
ncbi:MAG: hypothetical protein HXX08_05690 [Chloroflexi bacterium]|uniref:DUF6630 domain-containing protein n=1 Tax=Candidatus Chlorohelix allophototropha TaxID=3003348 RepID=A0A8T7M353_9CHLR|nr:hypothetical protein [Chloroflexota bacterium]WJW67227.1 hypothetical protein OZ401_000485 [Chloroflexota bacterium L227-S17]